MSIVIGLLGLLPVYFFSYAPLWAILRGPDGAWTVNDLEVGVIASKRKPWQCMYVPMEWLLDMGVGRDVNRAWAIYWGVDHGFDAEAGLRSHERMERERSEWFR